MPTLDPGVCGKGATAKTSGSSSGYRNAVEADGQVVAGAGVSEAGD